MHSLFAALFAAAALVCLCQSYTSVKDHEEFQPWENRMPWQALKLHRPQSQDVREPAAVRDDKSDQFNVDFTEVKKSQDDASSSSSEEEQERPRSDIKSESLTPRADRAKKIIDEYIKKFFKTPSSAQESSQKPVPLETRWKQKPEMSDDNVAAPVCGYASCDVGRPDMINVHLVPHTHDDVGWLKTVDQYFYGAREDIQGAAVQIVLDTVFNELRNDPGKKFIYVEIAYFSRWWDELHDSTKHLVRGLVNADNTTAVNLILDTVMNELRNDPSKRFIYVEMAFFTRWWDDLHDSTKHFVRGLVNSGQLQFTLGGWCMNDEAATHYSSIIDQHTLGFRFLYQNFGECGRPLVGWQIDPFGHSREQASLFAQFGFDGLFFARIDYQDMDVRLKSKTMESIWMGSDSLGDQSTLFTGVLYNGYGPPGGFCFECGDTPIMATLFTGLLYKMYQAPYGFCFECGDTPIMDDPRLEDYNVDQRVNDFLKAVQDQASHYSTNHIMMTFGSDFQYENARLNFKNQDKLIMHVNERVCKQMDALSMLDAEKGGFIKVDRLRRALGVLQHHDGVSGTEKQHVAYDYARMVAEGVKGCEEVVSDSYGMLLPLSTSDPAPEVMFCPLANVSNCPASERNSQFVVVVYNPLGHNTSHWVRIPVTGSSYTVTDSKMLKVTNQIVPVTMATKGLPDHVGSTASNELVFQAMLPALGFNTYFVKPATKAESIESSSWISQPATAADITIKNEYLSVTFSGTTNLLKSITNLETAVTLDVNQTLLYYRACPVPSSASPEDANPCDGRRNSGAYAFTPADAEALPISNTVTVTQVNGVQVLEVQQKFTDWASQVFRLYMGSRHLEIDWTVGHIPVSNIGMEIISRYATSMATDKIFYTDANGRELLKRVRDYRPTWSFTQTEPVAGNYFPINSRIALQDIKQNVQLTVLTDRSHGGGSIRDGQMEIMIHRRLWSVQDFGEALNEPGLDGLGLFVRGRHYIFVDTIANSVHHHREMAQRLFMSPVVGYIASTMDPTDYTKHYRTTWSGIKGVLPPNVHLLTLEQWHSGYFLLRLEHFFAKGEDAVLSKPATVPLKGFFAPFEINTLDEVTLGANQMLANATRLQWSVANYGLTKKDMISFVTPIDPATFTITLQPMQIRTFLVVVNENRDWRNAAYPSFDKIKY